MIHAYDESILEYGMDNLGVAVDYAVNHLKLDGQEFLNLFVVSGIAAEFECGNEKYVAGMSGCNLADEVYAKCGKRTNKIDGEVNGDYTKEYWCGWILAYYQWYSGISFRKLIPILSFETLLNSYGVLHESDNSKAVSIYDGLVRSESFLARMRKKRGMTQAALAEASHVSLRSIQLYEQRKNDISRAQYNNLKDIVSVLHCNIEDILE